MLFKENEFSFPMQNVNFRFYLMLILQQKRRKHLKREENLKKYNDILFKLDFLKLKIQYMYP